MVVARASVCRADGSILQATTVVLFSMCYCHLIRVMLGQLPALSAHLRDICRDMVRITYVFHGKRLFTIP